MSSENYKDEFVLQVFWKGDNQNNHSVNPPRGLNLESNFQKKGGGGLGRTSTLRGGNYLQGRRGCNVHIKAN